jgi:hypothetical protein
VGICVNRIGKVQCVDLSGDGRFDFLASRGDEQIEIECKTTTADTGRKIHHLDLAILGGYLLNDARRLASSGGVHLVLIEVSDRLSSNEAEMKEVRARFSDALSSGDSSSASIRVRYRRLSQPHLHIQVSDEALIDAIFKCEFGETVGPRLFHGGPSGMVVVGLRSAEPDRLFRALIEEVKKAAEQCSGQHPAVVVIQLIETEVEVLSDLIKKNRPLHLIVYETLRSQR